MTHTFIEHVNITVSDPDESAALFMKLFDWQIRWRGPAQNGGHSIHVGNHEFYFAVYATADSNVTAHQFKKGEPLNHIGLVVDDLDEVERRVLAEGYDTFNHADYEPGRRFYFFDRNGIEFEIVSYS